DVVPLTLVAVKPVLKIKGVNADEGTATSTLGRKHEYTMEFTIPIRTMGEPVDSLLTKTITKDIVTGNTDAIAINTDYVLPPELRPNEDTETDSYFADQVLYRLAVDYLDRLQYTHEELADILGGQFTHTATRVAIFNGIDVTNSMGQPYSF